MGWWITVARQDTVICTWSYTRQALMEYKMSPLHLELHTQQVIVQLKLKECETAQIYKKGEDIRYRSLHSYWRNIRNQRKVHNCSIQYRHTYWYILDIIVQFIIMYGDQIKKLLLIILWTINRSEHIGLYTIRYILLMLHYLLTGNIILWYKGGSTGTNLVEKCKIQKKHILKGKN